MREAYASIASRIRDLQKIGSPTAADVGDEFGPRPPGFDPDAESPSMRSDVGELLLRAFKYDDKPHQLYSHIAAMARRHEADLRMRAEILRLMDEQYVGIGFLQSITEEEQQLILDRRRGQR